MTTATQTFTLRSKELGGQFANRQYANGMGFNGENQSPQLYGKMRQRKPKVLQLQCTTWMHLQAVVFGIG